MESRRDIVGIAIKFLNFVEVDKIARLRIEVHTLCFITGARLIVAIKRSTFFLSEGHEYDWTLCHDRMDNECRKNDDKDRKERQSEVKLSASNVPARVLEEEPAGL